MSMLKETYQDLNKKTEAIVKELEQIRTDIKALEKTEKILKEQLKNFNAVIYTLETRNPGLSKLVDEATPTE